MNLFEYFLFYYNKEQIENVLCIIYCIICCMYTNSCDLNSFQLGLAYKNIQVKKLKCTKLYIIQSFLLIFYPNKSKTGVIQ